MKPLKVLIPANLLLALVSPIVWPSDSVCYGTSSDGRLEGGVQIPEAGSNFAAYSSAGVLLGRTYVHSKVAKAISDAYKALAESTPKKTYIYGESGWEKGGRIRPHRTHQNGTAIDFMVPVVDQDGKSVALPTLVANKFGYSIEFNKQAKFENLTIDFEALANHLYELDRAAKANGIGISRVIFDKNFITKLYATQQGEFVRKFIPFMKGEPWIRHDEHYHVDFAVRCNPK
jgi:penicillin-insensitive murein endopeptidase